MRLRQAALALVLTLAAPWSLAGEYVVGILTPLSGAWSPVGQSMRNGIALALEQAEDRGRFRPGVRLSLKDFDDDAAPADLARRTERMVHDQDAILVIGPMFSTNAQAMAVTANRFAFPLLTPAVSEGITAAGRWAFRSGASPHRMIEAMTRTAIDALHARKIAAVYPAANPGFEAQAHTVGRVATQMGKLVVGEVALTADDEDGFAQSVAALKSVAPDIIFVCLDAEPAGVFASRLRRAGITEATRLVFGPAAAQPALLEVGRAYVENALVATDYLPELRGEQNQAFVVAYTERYGKAPDRYAGIGYATGLIAAEAVRAAGPSPTRELMRDALERVVKLTVPLGQSSWTVGPEREPLYAPAFFSIRAGAFVPWGPAP
jgi:branched-chain amino acid transport system substrate-binding protein